MLPEPTPLSESLPNTWWVTFGDLLTLLLCLFIALISFSPLGDPYRKEDKTIDHSAEQLTKNDGIPIANIMEKQIFDGAAALTNSRLEPQYITEDELINGLELSASTLKRLQIQWHSLANNKFKVLVESCSSKESTKGLDLWLVSRERALKIMRQLVDSGASNVALAAVGPWCGNLNKNTPKIGVKVSVIYG